MTQHPPASVPEPAAFPSIRLWPVVYVYFDTKCDRFVISTDEGMPRVGDIVIHRHSGAHAEGLSADLADTLNRDAEARALALDSPRAVRVHHATQILQHRVAHSTSDRPPRPAGHPHGGSRSRP